MRHVEGYRGIVQSEGSMTKLTPTTTFAYRCGNCGHVLAVTRGREQTIQHGGRVIVCRLIATTCDRCGTQNVFEEGKSDA